MDDRTQILAEYLQGPQALAHAIEGLSRDELRSRPVADKWSIHEVVCHLADFELINAERIQRTLAEDVPTVFNAEPESYVNRLAYDARETSDELAFIDALRKRMASLLRCAEPAAWDRLARHSTDGMLAVREFVQRVTRHIPHHIAFIAEKRTALNRGV